MHPAVKKPAVPPRSAAQSQSSNKNYNYDCMIQRAIDLVHKGQLTAGVAIKMFGIPKTTFYRKLSMWKQHPEPVSTAGTEAEQYYETDSGTEDYQLQW